MLNVVAFYENIILYILLGKAVVSGIYTLPVYVLDKLTSVTPLNNYISVFHKTMTAHVTPDEDKQSNEPLNGYY